MQVFDPLHVPAVSVETPAAFQYDKMSVVSMDVLQSLNPKRNQISSKEPIQITTLHSNNACTSLSDPSYTDKSHYKPSIPHNNNMTVNQSSVKAFTENGDSKEQVSTGINGLNNEKQYLTVA